MFYTASDVAIWILVLFTVDRFLAVCFPLSKRYIINKPMRASLLCCAVFIFAFAKNFHVFWTRGPEYRNNSCLDKHCGRPHPYYVFEEFVRPWVAFVTISVLPFLIILVSNILIIRTLLRARYRQKHTVLSSSRMTMRQHSGGSKLVGGTRSGKFTQTTLMCLSASLAFLVCVTPSIVLTVGRFRWSEPPHRKAYYMSRAVTHQLACLNHAVNFFLYCLSGQRFRSELIAMLQCKESDAKFAREGSRYTLTSTSTSIRQPTSPTIDLLVKQDTSHILLMSKTNSVSFSKCYNDEDL